MKLARVLTITLVALIPFNPAARVAAQVKAYSVVLSNDRIVLDVQVEGRSSATIHVRNGEMARVTPDGAPTIGLSPVLKEGRLQLVVLEVLVDPRSGNEGLRQLAKHEMRLGSVTRVGEVEPALDVTWEATLPPASSGAAGPCVTCCVICDDALYCGCLVITECGRCCCPAVCQCPFEPTGVGLPTVGGCGLPEGQPERDQRVSTAGEAGAASMTHSTTTGTGPTSKRFGTPKVSVRLASSVRRGSPPAAAPSIRNN